MKLLILAALIFVAACSSPTAPTPIASAPTVVTPPVVMLPPPIVVPPPAFPPSDPRFDLAFYRQLAHNALEGPLLQLRRQAEAPRIYLRTVDDAGVQIDASTLDQTAAALINTAGALTGVFGLAGLERGTGTRQGQPGWITVLWADHIDRAACGRGFIGGDTLILYPKTPNCRCAGGPAVGLSVVKHELGHVLGFYHTDNPNDLMSAKGPLCNMEPSEREKHHAAIAYTRPIGDFAP